MCPFNCMYSLVAHFKGMVFKLMNYGADNLD